MCADALAGHSPATSGIYLPQASTAAATAVVKPGRTRSAILTAVQARATLSLLPTGAGTTGDMTTKTDRLPAQLLQWLFSPQRRAMLECWVVLLVQPLTVSHYTLTYTSVTTLCQHVSSVSCWLIELSIDMHSLHRCASMPAVLIWICGSQHRCVVCTNICFLSLLRSAMTADDRCSSSCCQSLPCKAQCAVRSTWSHDCILCVAAQNLVLACCCFHSRVHGVHVV